MKLGNILMGALIVVVISSIASATLDAKVYTLCENNISVNLTPNFRLMPDPSTSSSSGMFMQGFTITGIGSKGFASLTTMDIYDEDINALGFEALSQIVSGTISYLSDSETDNTLGNWSAVNKKGENVIIDTLDTKGTPLSIYGKRVDMAFWNIEDSRYAFLLSSFDQNATRQIINTLEIN
jgi:hypothetical protein